jgi:hypothetical protein
LHNERSLNTIAHLTANQRHCDSQASAQLLALSSALQAQQTEVQQFQVNRELLHQRLEQLQLSLQVAECKVQALQTALNDSTTARAQSDADLFQCKLTLEQLKKELAAANATSAGARASEEALAQTRSELQTALEQKRRSDERADCAEANVTCVICLQTPRQTCFIPCKHSCCCSQCAYKVKECPLCRALIRSRTQMQLS